MPTCARCHKGYGRGELTCPYCATPAGSRGSSLSGWRRYALGVGLVLSTVAFGLGLVSGAIWLLRGEVLYGALTLLVGAPYSLAMATVFRYVLDRS